MIKHITDFIKFRLDDIKMYLTYVPKQEQYWQEAGKKYRDEKQSNDPALKAHTDEQLLIIRKMWTGHKPILDVGCAYGRLTEPLGCDGIDFSQAQLDVNRTSGKLYRGDISKLPMAYGTYELAFCSGVLMHNPPEKAKQIIKEMMRVADKGIIFEEVGRTSPYIWNHDYSTILTSFGLDFTIEDLYDEYLKKYKMKMKIYRWYIR